MTLLSEEDLAGRTAQRLVTTAQYCAEQNVDAAIGCAKLAHAILEEITACIRPGMRESAVRAVAEARFAAHGIERTWHPPYVRFGEHTLLTFREISQEDRVLGTEDIAFVDIGIVKNGIEGDAGKSLHFGGDPEHARLVAASKTIFDAARAYWKTANPSGVALYEFIYAQAEKLDVVWNLDPAGHLIGAFPHKGWKRGINHFPEKVEAGKWILEIQVRHKELPFGAFFEDLLY